MIDKFEERVKDTEQEVMYYHSRKIDPKDKGTWRDFRKILAHKLEAEKLVLEFLEKFKRCCGNCKFFDLFLSTDQAGWCKQQGGAVMDVDDCCRKKWEAKE